MTTPHASAGLLERLFKLSENKTSFRTEVLAGVTTFLTMCYIIIVNPLILSETGMDHGAVFVATCLAAAIGCLVMGLVANYPIALAPGMGLNAYFTYSVWEWGCRGKPHLRRFLFQELYSWRLASLRFVKPLSMLFPCR